VSVSYSIGVGGKLPAVTMTARAPDFAVGMAVEPRRVSGGLSDGYADAHVGQAMQPGNVRDRQAASRAVCGTPTAVEKPGGRHWLERSLDYMTCERGGNTSAGLGDVSGPVSLIEQRRFDPSRAPEVVHGLTPGRVAPRRPHADSRRPPASHLRGPAVVAVLVAVALNPWLFAFVRRCVRGAKPAGQKAVMDGGGRPRTRS
jgi:hypothetical protein